MTHNDAERFAFRARWAGYAVGAAGLLAMVLVTVLVARQLVHPPPFEFSDDIYLPYSADMCPGGTLRWDAAVTVREAPTMLVLVRTVWDSKQAKTVVVDQQPEYYVWTEADEGMPIKKPLTYQVPAGLDVGLYELRVAAGSFNSDVDAYRVPFAITASCFKGETS